jgi:hypothetical protein
MILFYYQKLMKKELFVMLTKNFVNLQSINLEELIGKPHNIVRHPDMPKAAFKDLWETVQKAGKAWKGFVKNSTKSGKFYWVFATVFPFIACDGSKAYISCRRMASQDEIDKYKPYIKNEIGICYDNNFKKIIY